MQYFELNSLSKKIRRYSVYPQRIENQYLSKSQREVSNENEILQNFSEQLNKLASKTREELRLELTINDYLAIELAELFSFENKIVFDNPSGIDPAINRFSCPIGIDMIFISTNGDIHMCMKSDYSWPLGNVNNGINIESVYTLYSSYLSGFRQKCLSCWSYRFCKVCPAQILNEGIFCYPTEEECMLNKKSVELTMNKYIILVQNEKLYDDIKSFYFDSERVFLNYEGSVNVKKINLF